MKFFNRLIDKLRMWRIDNPLPPPEESEMKLVRELRHSFDLFPPAEALEAPPSEAEWIDNMNCLRDSIMNNDPREFLRWDVIRKTMFVESGHYVEKELCHLKSRPDWDNRWREAIKESPVGHPLPCLFYPDSSGNLIHHAYHIAQFEEKTGMRAGDMEYVFEFGGGYGSMCRLFHNLGFQGKYVIYDLPHFSILQQFYLKSLGISLLPNDKYNIFDKGVICISDIEQFKNSISGIERLTKTMFVATWSISEVPLCLRNLVLPLLSSFNSFLIGYQNKFGEVDNTKFFKEWENNFNKKIAWQNWPIQHIDGNNYLIGKSRELA